jgi:hypothetical protein
MGWRGTLRAVEAAQRRELREAQKCQRDLERRAKEQAKLSAMEQARLEVETYENQLEVLLSTHRQQGEPWDWAAVAGLLSPVRPPRYADHEFRIKQQLEISGQHEYPEAVVEQARLRDEQEFQDALRTYEQQKSEWKNITSLARRILDGEHKAYIEALVELNPFEEIGNLGSSLHFTIHNPVLVECRLKVNGRQAIPSEVKSLTSSGKVSVKTMPKGRFHEIYQDYVCACVLRVAREVLALLPVDIVLITASADELDPRTGHIVEQPVLSVALPRMDVLRLNFDQVDPSDAMENFVHHGDFKASRKTGAFELITPLTVADIPSASKETMPLASSLMRARQFRDELRSEVEKLKPLSAVEELATGELP